MQTGYTTGAVTPDGRSLAFRQDIADLERLNCNLVGGDPYSGVCSPDQFFWLRPFAGVSGKRGHTAPYANLYHIGASTHPGPGLGGGSGWMVANPLS